MERTSRMIKGARRISPDRVRQWGSELPDRYTIDQHFLGTTSPHKLAELRLAHDRDPHRTAGIGYQRPVDGSRRAASISNNTDKGIAQLWLVTWVQSNKIRGNS
jgi:hypothetical protein